MKLKYPIVSKRVHQWTYMKKKPGLATMHKAVTKVKELQDDLVFYRNPNDTKTGLQYVTLLYEIYQGAIAPDETPTTSEPELEPEIESMDPEESINSYVTALDNIVDEYSPTDDNDKNEVHASRIEKTDHMSVEENDKRVNKKKMLQAQIEYIKRCYKRRQRNKK